MTTQRRSIQALNLLKAQHKAKIENYHKPQQLVVSQKGQEIKKKMAKAIIEDIESYALTRYPNLKLRLKCETGHSRCDEGVISIGFTFEPELEEYRAKLNELMQEESKDLAALEEWYTAFLTSCAGGSDVPVFNLKHLEGVSSEMLYHPTVSL